MAPKYVHALMEPLNVNLYGSKDFAYVIKLRILRRENIFLIIGRGRRGVAGELV